MRFYTLAIAGIILLSVLFLSSATTLQRENHLVKNATPLTITPETYVWDALAYFGKIKLHALDKKDTLSNAEIGKSLVFSGTAINPITGKLAPKLNNVYTCNACHNSEKEFKSLLDTSAAERFAYAKEQNLPYVMGNSFYGIVNRVYFFTGEYQTKYSMELDFKGATTNLRRAINFCAQHVAEGRPLEKWETESILAYFWTLQLKIKDIDIPQEDIEKIEFAIQEKVSIARAVNLIENKYKDRYTSSFAAPMTYRSLDSKTSDSEIRFENGKKIYELSCMHCHKDKRFSPVELDYSKKNFQVMDKRLQQGHKGSIYKITREGSTSKKACMPIYTREKLSDEQLIDLRVYVQKMAS